MTTLKEWMDAKWHAPGVQCVNHGTAWLGDDVHSIHARAGTARNYKSKEQKAYEARFGIYNKKLVPIILAEATQTTENVECAVLNEYGRPVKNGNVPEMEVKRLPVYRWPAHEKAAPIEQTPAIPRKRVPKAKLEQAAAIIAKVPQDELTAFLARFGLSLSLAAHLVALGDPTMIARQFLRATL
jgi:hypothetical protein